MLNLLISELLQSGSPTQFNRFNNVKYIDFRATTAGSPTQFNRVNNVKSIDFRATTSGSPTQYINNVKSIDFRVGDYSRFSHSVV